MTFAPSLFERFAMEKFAEAAFLRYFFRVAPTSKIQGLDCWLIQLSAWVQFVWTRCVVHLLVRLSPLPHHLQISDVPAPC